MNEIIPVKNSDVGGEMIPTVSARELHGFLDVGRDFSNWIRGRIEKYGFVEGRDFVSFQVSAHGGENLGGRPSTEYALTLDMGKQLAMVENNDRGRQARVYFIECERSLRVATETPRELVSKVEAMAVRISSELADIRALIDSRHEHRDESAVIPPWAAKLTRRTITDLAKARTRRSTDPKAYRRERGVIELELRARFGFAGTGKAWQVFPLARWSELRARLEEMRRETARVECGSPAQLNLIPGNKP